MDPYDILGIPRNASREEIKKSYRKEAMKWHPDRNNNSPESVARFQHAASAYKILSESGPATTNDDFQNRSSGRDQYQDSRSTRSDYSSGFHQSDNDPKDNFAGELFWEVMLDFAIKLAQGGMAENEISINLSRHGCPDRLATSIADKAFAIHAQYASKPGTGRPTADEEKLQTELQRAFIGGRNILLSPRDTVEYYLAVFSQLRQTAGQNPLSRVNLNSRLMRILSSSIIFFALFVISINYYPGQLQFGNLTEMTLLQLPIGILSWMLIWTVYRKLWAFTLALWVVFSGALIIFDSLLPQALNNEFKAILLIAISCYLPFIFIAFFANYFYYNKARKTIRSASYLFFDHREKIAWIKNKAGTSATAVVIYLFFLLLVFQVSDNKDVFNVVNFSRENTDLMGDEETRLRSIEVEAGDLFTIAESHFKSSPPDYLKASVSYSIAADKRSLLAAYQLGYMYYHGIGVKLNDSQAFDYFELATRAPLAYQPHSLKLTSDYLAESYNNLGIMFEDGLGTKKNLKKAIAMYRKGAKFGSENARKNLQTVYSRGTGNARRSLLKPDFGS